MSKIKKLSPNQILGVVLAILLIGIFSYCIYLGFIYGWPDWTGFNERVSPSGSGETYQFKKTLWDWLQLLIVPVVLAIAAFFFNQTQQASADKIAKKRAKAERKLAEKRAQDEILEAYLDRMSELLVDKGLLKSKPEDEVRDVARVRTLTAIRRLDGRRNQLLIQFLRDAELIAAQKSNIINLRNADLMRASLYYTGLQGADLQGADLRGAKLQSANLQSADLRGADLGIAELWKANLRGANLQSVNLLGANLEGADLQSAILQSANLRGADLRGADLRGADLQGADLQSANLQGANLQGANLQSANLQGANLQGADLEGANLQSAELWAAKLQGADLLGADLEGANLTIAYMPNGEFYVEGTDPSTYFINHEAG